MKGIIYIRVSSDEQVKGTSLEFQEDLCRKYAAQKDIEIVGIYREEGESAKDLSLKNRSKFLDALEFCRKNKKLIDAFIVLRVDRFSRNTEDHFAIRKILLDYGVTLHSVTEPIGNKPAEKFIETVLAGAAEYDNAIRKQRCTDGMISRIKQGIYPWKPPLGYICGHFKKRGEKKNEPDTPDNSIFPLIQKALKEYAKGCYTQRDIMRMLIKNGVKTNQGKPPTPQLIDRILGKNLKFYAGIIVNPWNGEEIRGLHTPMISEDEMIQIQLVRSGKSNSTKHYKYNPKFPLRKIVLCEACRHPLTGSESRGNGGQYAYYHCYNSGCKLQGKGIAKAKIEKEFIEYLKQIIPKRNFLLVLKNMIFNILNERTVQDQQNVKKYEAFIKTLESKRRRIFEMREDGSYTKEEFLIRKSEIENEIATAKNTLGKIKFDHTDIDDLFHYTLDFISELGTKWSELPPKYLNRFQKLIFPYGIPYLKNRGFGTTNLAYIFELNKTFNQNLSSLVDHTGFSWNQVVTELYNWNKFIKEYEESLEIREVV